MVQTLPEFVSTYQGVENTGNTPENKGQCVGLVEVWLHNLGLNHIWGNAVDLLNGARELPSVYEVILNTPTSAPAAGDVIVLGPTIDNPYGHTAIVIEANETELKLFEQNNPVGSAPHIGQHDYNNVIGWIHPKTLPNTETQPVTDATYYKGLDLSNAESMKVAIDVWERLQQGELVDKHQYQQQADAASSCQTQLSTALEQNERNQAQITALQEELNKVKLDYNENEREIIALKGQLETVHGEDKDYAQKAYDSEKLAEGRKDLVDALADKLHIDPSITDEKQKVEECLKAVELLAKEKGEVALTHYQHLSNIVTDLIDNGGLNNFLKENGISPIDIGKLHDPQLGEKIKTYLDAIYDELRPADEATTETTPAPTLTTSTKPTQNFFSKTLLLPLRFVTNLLFTQSQS